MKLFFLLQFKYNNGGIQHSVLPIIKSLSQKEEFDVYVVTPKNSEMSCVSFPNRVTILSTEENEWIISAKHIFSTIKICRKIWTIMKSYYDNDSVIVTNDVGSSIIKSFMFKPNLKEIYVNRGGNFRKDKGLGPFLMRLKICFNRISFYIATSRKQKEMLQSSGVDASKIKIIYNGIEIPNIEYHPKLLKKSSLFISSIGTIDDNKNHILGVYLIKKLRELGVNAYYNIYGETHLKSDEIYKDQIKKTAEDLGISEFVNLKGQVNDESLFSETDILCSFSKSEGFGRTLVEAMLRYISVIAWRGAGGPVDITNDGVYCHLTEKNDYNDYLNVIMYLLNNPDHDLLNKKESYSYAINNFISSIMVDNYISFFQWYQERCLHSKDYINNIVGK